MKTALVNCPDTGPFDSLAVMLESAGYRVARPTPALLAELRRIGCDTVVDPSTLEADWGYEPTLFDRGVRLGPVEVASVDLFVDLKAQRSHGLITNRWPKLVGRTAWYRINGGEVEHVVNERGDFGDEVRPPCPVLTPNRWYGVGAALPGDGGRWRGVPPETLDRSYCFWPPLVGAGRYDAPRPTDAARYSVPLCLVHNAAGWGYAELFGPVRRLGVRVYGRGSPDGLVDHKSVSTRLSTALAYVHLKSNDAPGYAMLEALAAGCPVVVPRRLIWRCNMGDLLEEGVTCLCFDRDTHDALTPATAAECADEIAGHLTVLRDPAVNRKLGDAGRDRLRAVSWSPDRSADVASLRGFFGRHFG